MNQLAHLFHNIKVTASVMVAIIVAFLMPIIPLIIVVGVFIFADTAFGIWRAVKTKQSITSKRLSNIVSKMVLYQSSIILFFIMEKYMLCDIVGYFISIPWFITKLIACTLCSIELKSIDESFRIVLGVSLWEKFKLMLKRTSEMKTEIKDAIE